MEYSKINGWWLNWSNYETKEGVPTAAAISKSNPDVFYFANQYYDWSTPGYPFEISLWKTENDGATWTNLINNTGIPSELITTVRLASIDIHPSNPNKVWISFGNFSEDNKIFQTSNGGTTWQNISYDLANIPVNNVKYDKETDVLFAATDVGLFYLSDVSTTGSDQTWERFGDFPLVIASDIKINNTTRQLVVATYGRGIWRADLSCINTGGLTQIASNETWSDIKAINQDVEVLSGATLTITGETKIATNARITVNPGAKLILDGATLTNKCGAMWKGIALLGNPDQAQNPNSNQGVLEIKNGAIIENAETGVWVANPEHAWQQTGGILKVNNATFRNCVTSIAMGKYTNTIFGDIPYANQSYIKNSTFETTDYLANLGKNPYAFISLWAVDGVGISNNTFTNLNPSAYSISTRRYGIKSWSANSNINNNTFTNLHSGINSGGIGKVNYFTVSNNTFTNNFFACYFNGLEYSSVHHNHINFMPGYTSYGIYIRKSSDFTFEENDFTGTSGKSHFGIYLYGT